MNQPLKEGTDQICFQWFCKKKKKRICINTWICPFLMTLCTKRVNDINQILSILKKIKFTFNPFSKIKSLAIVIDFIKNTSGAGAS